MRLHACTKALLLLLLASLLPASADAYSVLSHEEVVDMAWKDTIVPMLRSRFPGISPDQIREAHAYAYGGSVIQDIGYYPFGSHYFSDLLHYVRPDSFVNALIRDSTTPNEYAFALGALAHFSGDIIGHPAINQVTSSENPRLRQQFGATVTYAEDPTAHIRTEFGFDVVEVAQGHYSQDNYRDFIGFQVAKPLLERAFLETYGLPMGDIIKHEDLAISTYRRAVSSIIPKMTTIAFVSYKNEIQQAAPGTAKRKFIYRLNQTEYQKDYGTDYTHVGVKGQVGAFFFRFVPKIGPFRALKVTIPDPQQQEVYLRSINSTVDRLKLYLGEIHAAPAPLPPPDPRAAADTRRAANKLQKDAVKADQAAAKAEDPADKAKKEQAAQHVNEVAATIAASAEHEQAQLAAASASPDGVAPTQPGALPPGTPIQPPSTPRLPRLDLDTGRPSSVGEYKLADEAYAHLLNDLVKPAGASQSSTALAQSFPTEHLAPTATLNGDPAGRRIDHELATSIETFFAHPVARIGPAPTPREAARETALAAQVKSDLATLRTLETTSALATH